MKYAGGLSYQDARFLANDMRCEPDFLTRLKTDISAPPKWTQFAVYADNWNDNHSMLFTLPFFTMEREPKMTPDQYAALLARNRQRTALVEQGIKKTQPPQSKPTIEQSAPAATPKPIASQPPSKTRAPQPTPNTDPDHGEAGEPANKW